MIKKTSLYIIIAIILCVIIIPLFFIFTGKEALNPPENKESSSKGVQTEFKEVNFTLYNDNKTIKWELTARELSHNEQDDYLDLSPLEITVYDNNKNEILYKFTAKKGNYLGNEEKLKIAGPVIIKLANYHLKAGEFSWQQKNDIIKGSSGVEITTTDGSTVKGDYMITDSRMDSITIYGSEEKRAFINWKEQGNEKN